MFLTILTHLFSVFEVLNVCQDTCSVHETKEGFLEICLTACIRDATFRKMTNRNQTDTNEMATKIT